MTEIGSSGDIVFDGVRCIVGVYKMLTVEESSLFVFDDGRRIWTCPCGDKYADVDLFKGTTGPSGAICGSCGREFLDRGSLIEATQ